MRKMPYEKSDYIPAVRIKKIMIANLSFCTDNVTGEINTTQLAELAASHFHDIKDVPERFFELAFEVAERHENRNNHRIRGDLGRLINKLDSDWF